MRLKHRGIETEVRDVDREERTFVARAATKNPIYGRSLLPESWDFTRFRKNPVMPWSHDYWGLPLAGSTPVVGKSLWEKVDKEGLLFKPQFADKEFARDLFDLYADGYMSAFSVGFESRKLVRPDDARFDELKKKHNLGEETESISIDTLLYEISPVILPADEDALKQALSEDRVHTRALRDAIEGEFEGRNAFEKILRAHGEEIASLSAAFEGVSLEMKQVLSEIDALQEVARQTRMSVPPTEAPVPPQAEEPVPPFPLGISGAALVERVGQAVTGEIRRMQGKVEG